MKLTDMLVHYFCADNGDIDFHHAGSPEVPNREEYRLKEKGQVIKFKKGEFPTPCLTGLKETAWPLESLSRSCGALYTQLLVSGRALPSNPNQFLVHRVEVLAIAKAENLLHEFACDQATGAIKVVRDSGVGVPQEFDVLIQVKRDWITHRDSSLLEAAWEAARAAAREVAWEAAWAAARTAANSDLENRLQKLIVPPSLSIS